MHKLRHELDAPTFAAALAKRHLYEFAVRYPSATVTIRRRVQPRPGGTVPRHFVYDANAPLLGHGIRVEGVERVACAEALTLAGLDAIMGYAGE